MRVRLLIGFILIVNILYAQNTYKYPEYPNPVKIPIYLSATFGELRSNAFHAGVDIKTNGKTGYRVYAVADGYVSRIGVSPWGYGNVVYVTHNDGFMSVYAHLDSFKGAIGKYVRDKQFANKSFAQNLFLEKDVIPVKAGDVLGLSGNSGGSGGPHLHYEIRNSKQHPVNPFFFGLKINDGVKPVINGLALYPAEESSVNGSDDVAFLEVFNNNGNYYVKNGDIKVNGTVHFGISTYDLANGSSNKNGVYSIELFADNKLIFNVLFDEYSYDETRYINSLIDYKTYIDEQIRYVRTEIDEYNILGLYEEKAGSVTLKEGERVEMKYVVKDYFNNTSTLIFSLVGDAPLTEYTEYQYNRSYYRVDGKSVVEVGLDGFHAIIPEKAFYRFEYILARQIDTIRDIASDFAYILGTNDIPVQKSIAISIRPAEKYASSSKLYVVSVDKDGKFASQGGKMTDGMVCTNVRTLGTYALAVDEVKPTVTPLNFQNNTKVIKCKQLKVNIKDKESGINTYDIYLNGKWVIGAYDAKNDLLFYDVDDNLKIGKNKMEIVVTDAVGNETRKVYNIIRESSKK